MGGLGDRKSEKPGAAVIKIKKAERKFSVFFHEWG